MLSKLEAHAMPLIRSGDRGRAPYRDEFFIESNLNIRDECLGCWFYVKNSILPVFEHEHMTNKIYQVTVAPFGDP